MNRGTRPDLFHLPLAHSLKSILDNSSWCPKPADKDHWAWGERRQCSPNRLQQQLWANCGLAGYPAGRTDIQLSEDAAELLIVADWKARRSEYQGGSEGISSTLALGRRWAGASRSRAHRWECRWREYVRFKKGKARGEQSDSPAGPNWARL